MGLHYGGISEGKIFIYIGIIFAYFPLLALLRGPRCLFHKKRHSQDKYILSLSFRTNTALQLILKVCTSKIEKEQFIIEIAPYLVIILTNHEICNNICCFLNCFIRNIYCLAANFLYYFIKKVQLFFYPINICVNSLVI